MARRPSSEPGAGPVRMPLRIPVPSPLRLPAGLVDEPVPALGRSGGALGLAFLGLLVVLLGLGGAVAGARQPSSLHPAVGVGDVVTATVEAVGVRDPDPPGLGCDTYWDVDVRWPDGSGALTECRRVGEVPYRTGQRVEVVVVPWTSLVSDTDREELPVAVLLWLAAITLVVVGVRTLRGAGRLRGGTAHGPAAPGQVESVGSVTLTVRVDGPDGPRRLRLVTLSADSVPFRDRERVTVHATRRTLLARRPAGPWVVRPRGGRHGVLFSLAWVTPRGEVASSAAPAQDGA